MLAVLISPGLVIDNIVAEDQIFDPWKHIKIF